MGEGLPLRRVRRERVGVLKTADGSAGQHSLQVGAGNLDGSPAVEVHCGAIVADREDATSGTVPDIGVARRAFCSQLPIGHTGDHLIPLAKGQRTDGELQPP